MFFRLITDSAWLTFPILAAGILFWWWSTYYLKRIADHRINILLRTIRILALGILVLLAVNLQALWRSSQSLPPAVAIYVDNSRSMHENTDTTQETLQALIAKFERQNINYLLYAFAEDIRRIRSSSALRFDEQLTDLSLPLFHMREHQRENNIRSALIISDGGHNSGVLPESIAPEAAAPIPVYTHFIGDSIRSPDIRLEHMMLPRVVYAGDSVQAQLQLTVEELQQETTLNFRIAAGSQYSEVDSIRFPAGTYSREMTKTFSLSDSGKYEIVGQIDTVSGEQIKMNNLSRRQIKVLPSRYQVLLCAENPSYETRFAGEAIRQMERFSLQTYYASLSSHATLDSLLAQADIVYVIGSPASELTALGNLREYPDLKGTILQVNSRGGVVEINTSNSNDWMEEGVQIGTRRDNPLLSVIPRISAWEQLPPVWTLPTPGDRLLRRVILRGSASGTPVVMFHQNAGMKIVHILGQHLWRWGFAQQQMEVGIRSLFPENVYRATLAQLLYWILQTSPTDRLQVWTEVDQQNLIRAEAQVYTTSMKPVDIAKVLGEIVDSTGRVTRLGSFARHGEMYVFHEKIRVPGEYRFRTQAYTPTDTLEVVSAAFRIPKIDLEARAPGGNPERLRNISARHPGELLSNVLNFPTEQISESPNRRESNQHTLHLRSAHWVWGVLVVMFAIDWWIRRRNGLL